MKTDVLDRLKKSAAIPSMPQVITRFLEIAEDPDFRYDDMVEVLGTDPGMVGDVLRLANSAFFGVTKQIDSLKQATTLLGVKRVRSLVIGRYMVDQVGQAVPDCIDLSYYWRRSLATGVLATKFVSLHRPQERDAAFIAGLLADIGVIVMANGLRDEYEDIARLYTPDCTEDMMEKERARFGVTHADVSAMVLAHWKLPANICDAVAAQDPESDASAAGGEPSLANAIHGASIVACLLAHQPEVDVIAEQCARAADIGGVGLSALVRMLDEIGTEIESLAHVLKLDVIHASAYELIAKAIQQRLLVAS